MYKSKQDMIDDIGQLMEATILEFSYFDDGIFVYTGEFESGENIEFYGTMEDFIDCYFSYTETMMRLLTCFDSSYVRINEKIALDS